MKTNKDIIHARPSKAFFIDMITRDLGLTDCVLDLIDNSVDQAVQRSGIDVMRILTDGQDTARLRNTKISITFTNEEFLIEDSCGGISVDEAQNKVFLFGNPAERGAPAGLSVYGIGMKRAFFKIGRQVRVESATETEWFVVDIDVDEWKSREDDWTFAFTEKGSRKPSDSKHPPGITKIRISRLRDEVAERFSQSSFGKELTSKIAGTYSLFIKAGLDLQVKKTKIDSTLPTLGTYKKLTPARKLITLDGGKIIILIIASVTPKEDRTPGGWYVFCNGRMVLEADRSHDTGWGYGLAQWHNKFAHFVGYVYFKSEDVRLLPWTTTKQGVVVDSPPYQTALSEMQVQARPILNFLSSMYADELQEEDVVEREILEKARGVSIEKLAKRDASFDPDLVREKKKSENVLISIQYKKRRKDLDRIRQQIKKLTMSASRVGEYTFDYFIKQECE